MTEEEIKQRSQKAREYFAAGFNCSQAVVAACADLYDIDEQTALRMSASFGGGIGQMRMTCGAACGMFLLAGLQTGHTQPHQPQLKQRNYQFVQHLAREFEDHNGGLICAELLGLNGTQSPKQKRPCKEMVADAVEIYLTSLIK